MKVARFDDEWPSLASDSGNWQAFKWGKLIALAAMLLVAAFSIDVPIENYLLSVRMRGFVRDLLSVAEVFGNGFGVLLAIVLVLVLDPWSRWRTPRVAVAALGAGMVANLVKLTIGRARPHAANLDQAGFIDTFGGWLPLAAGGSAMQSFPSAHTATAVGLALGLAMLYPRGRLLFWILAAGVAAQRMAVGAHYASDVLVGAAVGCTWARLCAPGAKVGTWFDQWELSWTANHEDPPATLPLPVADDSPLGASRAA